MPCALERGDGGAVSEHEFSNLVQNSVHSHQVDSEEISLLYRLFDSNRDGFLELGELPDAQHPINVLCLDFMTGSFSATHEPQLKPVVSILSH